VTNQNQLVLCCQPKEESGEIDLSSLEGVGKPHIKQKQHQSVGEAAQAKCVTTGENNE
jgi:hypothetical protein